MEGTVPPHNDLQRGRIAGHRFPVLGHRKKNTFSSASRLQVKKPDVKN